MCCEDREEIQSFKWMIVNNLSKFKGSFGNNFYIQESQEKGWNEKNTVWMYDMWV